MGHPYVTAQDLIGMARALVADDKGLLAMDERTPTCNRRFAALEIPQTTEARRAYRELIVITPGLGESIADVILYDDGPIPRPFRGSRSSRAANPASWLRRG